MNRKELKEIICRVIDCMKDQDQDETTPALGCVFGDTCDTCDATTKYAIGEEG